MPAGMAPQYVELELTESLLMGNMEQIVVKMEELRGIGVGLSIDDFGTGYSCLSYLARFPLTTLKIDRAFVRDLGENSSSFEIARAIIALSQGLKLDIVADGAETRDHVTFLKEHDCHMAQGYYFSPPVAPDSFEKMLARGHIEDVEPCH